MITENQLDQWVRGNARDAQGLIVELVWRLVAASSPRPKERRFPLGDSIGQPGPDGVLHTDLSFEPFVPEGRSFWEIGTGIDAGGKASIDYKNLTGDSNRKGTIPQEVRRESAFIFVTPLSGGRGWDHTWKEDAQAKWLEERRQRNEWRSVHVIDGTGLIDWLNHFPAVERWLANVMGIHVEQIETSEQRWADLKTIGEPPPLIPQLFLVNREMVTEKLKEVICGKTNQLKVDTHFPNQVPDFVAACIANLDTDDQVDATGRCLIISNPDAFEAIMSFCEQHILVADFDLDEANSSGTILLQKARRAGHAVIFVGLPGGIPHANRASLPSPKIYNIKDALIKAGYKEERAHTLAKKSDGNLNFLLRCLQNLSLMPEWSQKTEAAELAVAQLLGTWNENCEADKSVAEDLLGKPYGEWIIKMREISLRRGTPLIQRDGNWKFVARYEGWHALGPSLFDGHLDRLKEAAISVLRERDPQFELSKDQRYTASIYGKVLPHSNMLRNGLAESLALLGSHPKALISCTTGKAEATAALSVREILKDADWVLWSSLNNLLPLIAEAAPGEFLDAVERSLSSSPCPFDAVFVQEGGGIIGRNYMTGLLWALETLAWDSDYLTRVVVILGELAVRDPGGSWSNRPSNSLSTILLPWFPQTSAPVSIRRTAVEILMKELPDVAWKLLLDLLPQSHQVSMGSHKPIWRTKILDEWTKEKTESEYWEQIAIYTELAIVVSKQDISRLTEVIDRLDEIPQLNREQLLAYLSSDPIVSMPEKKRHQLWMKLVTLISKHRKFEEAEWALPPEVVKNIDEIAEKLAPDAPFYRHQRLFSESDLDLYDEKDNYEEHCRELEDWRQKAVGEVFAAEGLEMVIKFAQVVESPWRVGLAFGKFAATDIEEKILPALLESENKAITQFVGGYIRGKFLVYEWKWIDQVDKTRWKPSHIGQLLAYLPFNHETWKRVSMFLEEDESFYWSKTTANPYEVKNNLYLSIDFLVQYDRPHAAIKCLEMLLRTKQNFDVQQAIRVLHAVLNSSELGENMDVHAIVTAIKALQANPDTNPDELLKIEWAFLPLLNRHNQASPKILEEKLANDPAFFCEVIRTVFRSKNEENNEGEVSEQQKNSASNAYLLLSNWRTPPGTQKDGTFKGDSLIAWVDEVKTTCEVSGHLEVALLMIGQVLIHTPPDPDGLWLHHAAARVLNDKNAKDIRDGFQTKLYNSRGVYTWSAGKGERKLAEKYRTKAIEVEAHGYQRIATNLRELSVSYEREADREASRDIFDD